MKLFGSQDVFLLELVAVADCPPFGFDVCMTANNVRIGNARPWFETYVAEFAGYLTAFQNRSFGTLSNDLLKFSDEELLSELIRALASDWIVGSDSVERYLLYNLDDALDGWHVFVTERNDQCRIWWSNTGGSDPAGFNRVSICRDMFIRSGSSFVLAAQQVIAGGIA
jgi:hypothetical protein